MDNLINSLPDDSLSKAVLAGHNADGALTHDQYEELSDLALAIDELRDEHRNAVEKAIAMIEAATAALVADNSHPQTEDLIQAAQQATIAEQNLRMVKRITCGKEEIAAGNVEIWDILSEGSFQEKIQNILGMPYDERVTKIPEVQAMLKHSPREAEEKSTQAIPLPGEQKSSILRQLEARGIETLDELVDITKPRTLPPFDPYGNMHLHGGAMGMLAMTGGNMHIHLEDIIPDDDEREALKQACAAMGYFLDEGKDFQHEYKGL